MCGIVLCFKKYQQQICVSVRPAAKLLSPNKKNNKTIGKKTEIAICLLPFK